MKAQLEINSILKHESAIDRVLIEDVHTFKGPCSMKNHNFGLFVAQDKEIVVFYYKDETQKLKINYYSLEQGPNGGMKEKILDFQFETQGMNFSLHSPTYKKYIQINKNTNQFLVKAFNNSQFKVAKAKLTELDKDQKTEQSMANRHKVQKVLDDLLNETLKSNSINRQVQAIFNASPNVIPNFLSEDEILFMNSDSILMGYDVVQSKETFNVTQCNFPGSLVNDISLYSLQLTNNMLIGKNCLIYERLPNWRGKNKDYERVFPNNFNEFYHMPSFSARHTEPEDIDEMNYIQQAYKQKIEIMQQSYFGYIFQSKEFMDAYHSEIYIVNTFTFYQWRTLDILESSAKFTVDLLPRDILQKLCFCQLGNGKTFLHKIQKSMQQVKSLFELVQNDNPKEFPFYIPLFSHASRSDRTKQTTVLDQLFEDHLAAKQAQDDFSSIFKKKKGRIEVDEIEDDNTEHFNLAQKKNLIKTAYFLLEQIGTYPFDLFKINLEELIKPIIENDPVAFCYFIDARSKIPDFLSVITEGNVFSNKTIAFTKRDLFQVNDEKLNDIASESNDRVSNFLGLQRIDTIQMKVIDIPFIHVAEIGSTYENNNLLFDKLHDENSIDIYGLGAVKALIEVRWNYVWIRLMLIQLIPFSFYLIVFTIYISNDWQSYATQNDEAHQKQAYACRILILIAVAYSLLLQLAFFISSGFWEYVTGIWNLLELTADVLIIAGEIEILYLNREFNNMSESEMTNQQQVQTILIDYQVRILFSLAALTLWLKSMYFFRLMRTTGYFIRMFIEVIRDLGTFLIILGVIIVAFALAFLLVERNNNNGGPIIGSFVESLEQAYQMPMGNYFVDYQDYNTWLGWVYFVLATILLNIMMLNLLISVISDTYSRIKDQYQMIQYKDLLHLINENKVLYRGIKRSELNQKYLFFTVPVPQTDSNQPILDKIEALNDTLRKYYNLTFGKEDNQRLLEGIDQKGNSIIEKLDAVAEIGVTQKIILSKLDALEKKRN